MFADIIIDISHESLDRTFQYRIPKQLENIISVGDRVLVPFGNGARAPIAGFVLDISYAPKIDESKIKDIIEITNDHSLVEQKLISLAYWMKSTYGSTMNHALKTVLPVKKSVRKAESKTVYLNIPMQEAVEKLNEYEKKSRVARARLVKALIEDDGLDYRLITGKLNVSAPTIKALCEQGIIRIETERVYRNSVTESDVVAKVGLNEKQQLIADDFKNDYANGIRNIYLLHGITGSGKTEVYMEMIDEVVRSGKSVIVLIPEIALTYQTVMRFLRRFGNRVSTLHSRLSDGERYDQFERARKHEIDIMIGPRSALFTPFDNLGLIVIDEEHENSYKSEQIPKYHAREVAVHLAGLHGASVVLGSATPDIGSYYNALQGEYKLYTLDERAKGATLPDAVVTDLREELSAGNKSIFGLELKNAISDRLTRGEQVMLFLNRRGYAGFISCRSCGEVVKCPHCDVSLSYHRNGKLVCHYCGYEMQNVSKCPKCNSKYIGGMRAGTEAVEEQIKKIFPYANVLRMDKDTTKQKDDYENILSRFANHEADILVGTQMIVKGHDFPDVTLVGVLAADMSLNANDYRAAERTYQLIVQASGRAGRDAKKGKVIIQTYQPEHYAIQSALNQNYAEFYEEEIGYRQLMGYPPTGHMLAVLIESKTENGGEKYARSLAEYIKNGIINDVIFIGPTAATVKKINDIYRYMIYVKSRNVDRLIAVKDKAEYYNDENFDKGIRISFDLDPVNGY